MNLQEATPENLAYLVQAIKERLNVVNSAIFTAEDFDLQHYPELYELYQMVHKKERLSLLEVEGLLEELGALRKSR